MNPVNALLVSDAIQLAMKLLANHLNRPEGWKPTAQDIQDFLDAQDQATPEHEKAEALKRLGLTERIPYRG